MLETADEQTNVTNSTARKSGTSEMIRYALPGGGHGSAHAGLILLDTGFARDVSADSGLSVADLRAAAVRIATPAAYTSAAARRTPPLASSLSARVPVANAALVTPEMRRRVETACRIARVTGGVR